LKKDLEVIQEASNRITRTVRSLRDFIYPAEMWEDVDLGDVIKDVLIIYGQRIANHNTRIKVEGLEGKRVYGHKIQLEQLFLSLINNSVDAIDKRPDKWISVTARTVGDEVEVTLKDSSPSRADEFGRILSDPLHVHHEFMDAEVRLVLAKEITQKHEGEFHCGDGEYSTFVLTFPLAEIAHRRGPPSDIVELH
jgi:C4-dicarboxylate-specific signal transduction histidine kinase